MIEVITEDFSGGINQFDDPTKLKPNEYVFATNIRTRFGGIENINSPLLIKGLPNGLYQGIYGVGDILVAFVSGNAYFYDGLTWQKSFDNLGNAFQMSTTASVLYAEKVPASTFNFVRELKSDDKGGGINLTDTTLGSPQGLLVQSGEEGDQPWIILPDGSCRITQNYQQWNADNREYVPIGKQMLFADGILFLVVKGPSGKFSVIGRSVSGRPLDFMVNIDTDGNKLPSELEGGVLSTSHRVDYDDITCLARTNSGAGSFFVSTANNSYVVIENLVDTIFGEPTFSNFWLFSTGARNHFSVVDILGDTALIDSTGLRSFNAVLSLKYEGRNSPFSARVAKMLDGVTQNYVAAWSFDNYALFAVKTIYGYGILVYDTLRQSYPCLDYYDNIPVKMFAEIKTDTIRKLYFITTDNKLFEFLGDTTSSPTARIYTAEMTSGRPSVELDPDNLYLNFTNVTIAGVVTVIPYTDGCGQREPVLLENLLAITRINQPSVDHPVGDYDDGTVQNMTFPISRGMQGWKVGYFLTWTGKTKLTRMQSTAIESDANNSIKERVRLTQNYVSP